VGVGARYLTRPEVVCKLEVNDCLARCDAGGKVSCALLGELYERGQGGAPRDLEQARRAYAKACDKRNHQACAALSELLLSEAGGQANPQRALELARQECEGSIPDRRACYALGMIHEQGAAGVSRDTVKAKSLYEHACKDQYGPACTRRGAMALEGPSPNAAEAKSFFDAACGQRDPAGCLALGNLMPNARATGDGFRAEQAFTIACEGGLARGCAKAARLRWPEWRKSDTWPEIARLLEKGCEGGMHDALACFDRGRLFEEGLGVPRDEQTAQRLYDAACRDVSAQDPEGQRACAHAQTRRARWIVDGTMLLRALEAACSGGDPTGCVELSARSKDPQRREELHARACAPVQVAFEPIELAACARSKELQARWSSDPATAKRLFEEACAGGAGGACFELAKAVDAAWQKLPEAARTLPAMETRVAALVKGCHATAPSLEACIKSEELQRERGKHEDARALQEDACLLDPKLTYCRR
jgi:TPR repeat protein